MLACHRQRPAPQSPFYQTGTVLKAPIGGPTSARARAVGRLPPTTRVRGRDLSDPHGTHRSARHRGPPLVSYVEQPGARGVLYPAHGRNASPSEATWLVRCLRTKCGSRSAIFKHQSQKDTARSRRDERSSATRRSPQHGPRHRTRSLDSRRTSPWRPTWWRPERT